MVAKSKSAQKLEKKSVENLNNKTDNKITILSIVGLHSSGKSVIAKYISKKYGFYSIETGDIVREFAKKEKGVADEKTLPWAATYLFKKYGDKYILNKIIEKIEKQKKQGIKKFVVSGIKTKYTYKQLNKLPGSFKQIAVILDADVRYKRAKDRNRPDDEGADSRAQFNKRTWRELNQGVGNILAISDFFIDNSNGIEKSFLQVDEIMKKLKIKEVK